MKHFFSFAVALFVSLFAIAQPPKGPANSGTTYGETTIAEGAIAIDKLVTTIKEGEDVKVKVKGRVVDVCTQEGCWLKMQTAKGPLMVKMKNHAFLVPVDINGKDIVVDGTAKLKTTSVKELQHYAEDAKRSAEEIAAIKEPKREIVLNAVGVLVL